MSGGTLNLSLLSRGVGEIHKNGHEKVDVYLEPEDYLNFSTSTDRIYLPPLDPKYPHSISDNLTIRSKETLEYKVPKTYSTRRGALLLFSEDLAQKYTDNLGASETTTHRHGVDISVNNLHTKVYLKTVEDLANSVLKYGAQGHLNDSIYLKFVRAHCGTFERQFRPGFSAKRYLTTWSRTWDNAVFDNIVKHGYITEQSLYHYNMAFSSLRRRMVYDDLSCMPEPYKLMRHMLMTPGSLSGYTFYRASTLDNEEREDQNTATIILKPKRDKLHNIHVIKTKGRLQKEVFYSDLDRQSQKEVITDLLVKSAVHYALKKQEEVYKDTFIRAWRSEESEEFVGELEERSASSAIQEFDMKEAVESLLDSQHGRFSVGADLSEIDDRSQESDRSGSFKGGSIVSRASRHQAPHRVSRSDDGSESEKENIGGVQVVAGRGHTEPKASLSNVPVLPPIRSALSPIKDSSRETSQQNILLPPIDQDFEKDHSETEEDRTSQKKGDIESSIHNTDKENAEAVTGNVSSHHQGGITTRNSAADTKKTQGNWKSLDWRRGVASFAGSIKGSRIVAPDGEVISVGGSIRRGSGHVFDVADVTGTSGQQEIKDSVSERSNVTEDEIMDMLSNHARQVAENVLSNPSAGTDLENDVKLAATLWSKMHPSQPLSRSIYVGDNSTEVIDEIMASRSVSSAASSVDEYKSLIRKSLTTVVTRVAGLDPDSISDEAEISPALLEALVNQRLGPDQIEVVTDSQGHTRIQSKVEQNDVLGRIQEGQQYIHFGKDLEEGGRQHTTIIEDNVPLTRDVGIDRGQSLSQERRKPMPTSDSGSETSEKATISAADQKFISSGVKRSHKIPPIVSGTVSKDKKADKAMNIKNRKTGMSQKSRTSKDAKKKGKSLEEKEEPFIAGMPKEKKSNKMPPLSHADVKKVKKKKKEVKGKRKIEIHPPPETVRKLLPEEAQELPEIERQLSPQQQTEDTFESNPPSPETKSDDSEPEFNFVRDQSDSEPEEVDAEDKDGFVPRTKRQVASLAHDDDDDKSEGETDEDEEASKLRSITNREARAAKRAAAAAKRREEVEHRRKLKEEQVRKEKEEMERQIVLQKELEEQRRRGEEERRLRKQQQAEEEDREKLEQEEAERRQKLELEREKRAKEEYQRKLEEMKRKQVEEELRKRELMLQKHKEEEERKAAEEFMLSRMAKQERVAYEQMKREKEEERRKKELEDKLRQAEEAKTAMEEAQRLAEEMARKQAELEAKLRFNRSLQDEASRLTQAHSINRAFVFSYFELLQWLGLDIPEFELAKLTDY